MISSLFSQNTSSFAKLQVDQINPTQVEALKNVLAKYDADNVTEADAKSIVKEVKDIGIPPGNPLTTAFAHEGFNAHSIGEKAGIGKSAGSQIGATPPPQGAGPQGGGPQRAGLKGEINTEALTALNLLVEANGGDDISEDQWATFFTDLEAQGIDTTKPFIDLMI